MSRLSRSLFVAVVLFVVSVRAPAAPRGRLAHFCHRLLVRAGVVSLRTPIFFLSETDHREINVIVSAPELDPAGRYARLTRVWTNARLRTLSELDAQIVRNSIHYINDHSVHGIRADDVLERMVARPGMEFSYPKLADFVHDLERLILSFEFVGRIRPDRRPDAQETLREVEINRIYRDAVVRGEWEILSALPTATLLDEAKRVARLDTLPWKEKRVALNMLGGAHQNFHSYRKMHQRAFSKRGNNWRVAENPFATTQAPERAVVVRLITLWADTDRLMTRSSVRLSGPTSGQILTPAQFAARRRALRARALVAEWDILNPLDANTRRLAIELIQLMTDFSPAYRQRLRTAFELSALPLAVYEKHRRIARRFDEAVWAE